MRVRGTCVNVCLVREGEVGCRWKAPDDRQADSTPKTTQKPTHSKGACVATMWKAVVAFWGMKGEILNQSIPEGSWMEEQKIENSQERRSHLPASMDWRRTPNSFMYLAFSLYHIQFPTCFHPRLYIWRDSKSISISPPTSTW